MASSARPPYQPVLYRLVPPLLLALTVLIGAATASPVEAYDRENFYPIASLFPRIPEQSELVGRQYGTECAEIREKQIGPVVNHYWAHVYQHTSTRDLGIKMGLDDAHYVFECIGGLADRYSNALAQHARWGSEGTTCRRLLEQLEDEVRNVYLRAVCPLPGMACSQRWWPFPSGAVDACSGKPLRTYPLIPHKQ